MWWLALCSKGPFWGCRYICRNKIKPFFRLFVPGSHEMGSVDFHSLWRVDVGCCGVKCRLLWCVWFYTVPIAQSSWDCYTKRCMFKCPMGEMCHLHKSAIARDNKQWFQCEPSHQVMGYTLHSRGGVAVEVLIRASPWSPDSREELQEVVYSTVTHGFPEQSWIGS